MKSPVLIGIAAMAAIVVASNILVQFLLGDFLTWGALTYPLAFLVTDVTNRVYGAANARKVVWAGFFTGVVCSLIGTQIIGDFGPLVTLRVAIASGTGFLIAQMVDVSVFEMLREDRPGAWRRWWHAPLISSLVGSSLDTFLFFSIAFSASLTWLDPTTDVLWANETVPLLGFGPAAPLWISMGLADWGVKLGLALLALPPFRAIVRKLSSRMA